MSDNLRDDDKLKFNALAKAFADDRVCLIATKDKATGAYRAVIAITDEPDDNHTSLFPVGHLTDASEYEIPEGATQRALNLGSDGTVKATH